MVKTGRCQLAFDMYIALLGLALPCELLLRLREAACLRLLLFLFLFSSFGTLWYVGVCILEQN